MLVSIIVPIYKVENEIERCILSILEQDYPLIELILINDCTPDNSYSIAKSVIEREKYEGVVHYVEHKMNEGLSGARNTGIHEANGDYLFFLDSDDALFSQESIRLLIAKAIAHDYPEIVIGNYQSVLDDKVIEVPRQLEMTCLGQRDIFCTYSKRSLSWSACGRLICREFLLSNNLFFHKGLYNEDALWSFLVFRKAKSMHITSSIIFSYFQRTGSIMSVINDRHIKDLTYIVLEMYSQYQKQPEFCTQETILMIEKIRRLILGYMFKFGERDLVFLESQLCLLQEITTPIYSTKKLRFLKQNILLRMPSQFIMKYLILKWRWGGKSIIN